MSLLYWQYVMTGSMDISCIFSVSLDLRTVDISLLKMCQEIMWDEEMEQPWGEGLRSAGG